MATKRSSSTGNARTGIGSAGKPATTTPSRSRSQPSGPTKEELDLRDRLKAGPRRPAGPPLTGDRATRAAMDALRREVVPEPTDPKNRRGRK